MWSDTHTFVCVPNSCLFGYMICFLEKTIFLLVHLFSVICPLMHASVCVCVYAGRMTSTSPTFSLRNGGMCPRVGRPFPHLFPAQPSVCVWAHSQLLSLPNARTQWTLHIKFSGPLRMCEGVGSPDVPLLRLPASAPLFVCAVCVCVLLFSARAGMLFSAVSTVETPSDPVLHPAAPLSNVFLVFQS